MDCFERCCSRSKVRSSYLRKSAVLKLDQSTQCQNIVIICSDSSVPNMSSIDMSQRLIPEALLVQWMHDSQTQMNRIEVGFRL